MELWQTEGHWLGRDGWVFGVCEHTDTVQAIHACPPIDSMPRFLPAPLDLHVHGGGGADVMQGDEAIRQVLKAHAAHGCGALLATSVTAPFDQIDEFLASTRRVMNAPPEDGAHLLGAHLEGPFINPNKLGAQPNFPAALHYPKLEEWLSTGIVRVVTYAPELDLEGRVPDLCQRYGARAQMGHTLCGWAQACQALELGAGVTHLYNAMSPVLQRNGGLALAALAYADYAEIITDGIHADQAAFDAARRAIPKLYSVTDATAAAGMPDGCYELGSLQISKVGDKVLLPDGTLAGSCLTQQRSFQVLRGWGLDWPAIARMCSALPAEWIHRPDYGVIAAGARANWIEVNDTAVLALWLNGTRHVLGVTG